ncbi:MAG: hypothetical protein JRH17_09930 [Deltaproteobacteria bacterium]|nr:hypothetical protein [Deltaproteobacteria bacterium]MBW2362846.1 hypothetical protein [Deltaproteobacteria bacterium]
MRRGIAILVGVYFLPLAAGAVECPEWRRFTAGQKSAALDAMIEGHLNSNVGKKFTSENPVLMRRCLRNFEQDLIDQFDGVCRDERSAPKDALDQIFDRYFLSCVQ